MSTKKTETSAAVEEKKSKTDIETRMEAGKVEVCLLYTSRCV